jgi:hypothetical protein
MPKKVRKIIVIIFAFTLGFILAFAITTYASSMQSSSVYYDNIKSGGVSNTVSGALDELYEKANSCNKLVVIKIGDYVSMTPTSTSYTTDVSKTGYDSTQTINPSELNLWRVIRINGDNTLDMVSEYTSSVAVYFSDSIGYQNAVGYLNILASQYENENYTVGSRYMGYNKQTEYITTSLTTSNSGTTTTSSSTTAAQEKKGSGDEWYTTDTELVEVATGSLIAYGVSDKKIARTYWLASRYYNYDSSNGYSWSLRYINNGGSITRYRLYRHNSDGYLSASLNSGLRPIVTLKSGLYIKGGSGTSEDPYVLN